MEKNIHSGHRERLKKRFAEHGLESFSDVEAVELLLMYAIPRRDTNVLAHRLLDRFRGLRGLMEAGPEELREIEGIGENAAALICLTRDLNRRYLCSARNSGARLRTVEDVGNYLGPIFAYRGEEIAVLLCLDSMSRVLSQHMLAVGTAASVDFRIREVVDLSLRTRAVRVVLAHNHLTGTALPSNADVSSTRMLASTLRQIEVELADHLIFADGDFVSLRESGVL